jgi:hypothetical protein
MTERLWKVLDGVQAVNGGTYRYPGVGRWTRHLDPDRLEACHYGFHLARGVQLLHWLGPTIWEAEPCPDHPVVEDRDKLVTCRVRLVRRTPWGDRMARRFAADAAEAVLLGERASGREPDVRSWEAVAVARRFAAGVASRDELAAARDAARAAGGDAVWAAARDAGGAAARAAVWVAARDAVSVAACAAACAAARDAVWDAARDAARDAIYGRLCHYLDGTVAGPVTALYGEAPT